MVNTEQLLFLQTIDDDGEMFCDGSFGPVEEIDIITEPEEIYIGEWDVK